MHKHRRPGRHHPFAERARNPCALPAADRLDQLMPALERIRDQETLLVPDHAVDAQSLIALADLVVSAGGTMNREAAALGVPVYTTYGGRLGGVDEELIREGRLKPLTDPRALELTKRDAGSAPRERRDPAELLRLLLSALAD